MPRVAGADVETVIRRRECLQEYIERNPYPANKPAPVKEMMDYLKDKGFKDRGYHTIKNDLKFIAANNTFVRDIASKRYSQIMEDCYDNYRFVIEQSTILYNTSWTHDKVVKKHIIDKDADDPSDANYTEITEFKTAEIAEPKLRALAILLDATEKVHRLINGDGLKVSVDSWIQDKKQTTETIRKLNAEIATLKQNMKRGGAI